MTFSGTAYHSILYFVARAAPAVVQLLVSVFSIRGLGESTYVEFALALALVMGVGVFATAWLSQGIMRESHAGDGDEVVDGMVWKGASLVILSTVVPLWLAAAVVLRPLVPSAWVLVLLHAANVIYLVALGREISRSRPGAVLAAEFLRSAVMAAACLAVILLAPPRAAEWLLASVALSFIAGGALIVPPPRGLLGTAPPWRALGALFRRDGPVCLWFAAATVLFLADRFLLKDIIGAAATAQYILLADTIQRGAQFLLAPMIIAAQPVVARHLHGGAIGSTYDTIRAMLMLQAGVAAAAFAVAILCRDPFLKLLLGTPNEGAAASFVPLLLAAILWQMTQGIQKPLEYTGRLGLLTVLAAAAIIILVAVIGLGAPRHGASAAAWGLLAAIGTYAGTTLVFAARLHGRHARS